MVWNRWVRLLLFLLAAVAGGLTAILSVGWATPLDHHAVARTTLAAAPPRVWEILTDVAAAPTWRSGLLRVEVLSDAGEPLVFREHGDFGAMRLGVVEATPPRLLVTRILDEDLGFGGTWTYAMTPAGTGTAIEIREDGRIDSLLFRGLTRLVFGYTGTLETFLRDLSAVAGGDGAVEAEVLD